MSPMRIEVREPNGQSISVSYLNQGDSLSYPLVARKLGTQELVVIFPNGTYNLCTRTKIGPYTGDWQGAYHQLAIGKSQEFSVPPENRLIIKSLR